MGEHPLTSKMKEELGKLGQVEPSALQAHTNQPHGRLDKITFDPKHAKFSDLFAVNPQEFNERKENREKYKWRRIDARLSNHADNLFTRNGFVVGGCQGATQSSFGQAFDSIHSDDLPVFVSADSMLHAWHRTFDELLITAETGRLVPLLLKLLALLGSALVKLHASLLAADTQDKLLIDCCQDIDVFVTVAESLLAEQKDGVKAKLGKENLERVRHWLAVVGQENPSGTVVGELFGSKREIDASQFKVRGHYEQSGTLKRYFRAMMWIGRIDLKIGGEGSTEREVAGASLIAYLAQQPTVAELLVELDATLRAFIGEVDSCTVPQLQSVIGEFCEKNSLEKGAVVPGNKMAELRDAVVASGFGVQGICSEIVSTNAFSSTPKELAVSFTLMGQRFAIDSWLLSNIVFDNVVVDGKKVLHTRPSCVDVLYGCMGNSALSQVVARKIEQKQLPYHSYLIACKQTIDSLPSQIWSQSIYHMWLKCLRKLSDAPVEGQPQFMQTQAWGLKDAETQAASWAQLRHDTILYVKQSYGKMCCCEYPAGYVDPRPEFWQAFLDMVNKTEAMLPSKYDSRLINWKEVLGRLIDMSKKELADQKFSEEEETFLKTIARRKVRGSGAPTYDGWYPSLFPKFCKDAWLMDGLVSDVHSNPPGDQDPAGCVVHEATGAPTLMRIAVDSSQGAVTQYIGPVMSHYEFNQSGLNRVSDSEWQQKLSSNDLPPVCPWKSAFRAP